MELAQQFHFLHLLHILEWLPWLWIEAIRIVERTLVIFRHIRFDVWTMLRLLVVACRNGEVGWIIEHISLLRMDIHLHVRHREAGGLMYRVGHQFDRVFLLFCLEVIQCLLQFDICIQWIEVRRLCLVGIGHIQWYLQFGFLWEQATCLQCRTHRQLICVFHISIQHIRLDGAISCGLQSSCHIDLCDIADTQCRIRHSCHTTLLIELAQAQLIHPDLGAYLIVGLVAHTDHDRLHILQRRITQYGDLVVQVFRVIGLVWYRIAHIAIARSLRTIALHLGFHQGLQIKVKRILWQPYFLAICQYIFVVHTLWSQIQRYLIFIVVVLQVRTQTDETCHILIRYWLKLRQTFRVYEHL